MKVVGLITEYNPFHNGHKYHIEEAKRITGADYVVAVMSGNFVQRGTPAIIDKYSRTEMALRNGVDLVLELPVCYATGSAEFFAHGAVSLLEKLGIVDTLCFGSECGDIALLQKAAHFLQNTPASFDEHLQSLLKDGLTYPAARLKALVHWMEAMDGADGLALSKVLMDPNNILGIEYVKALYTLSSSIIPVAIQRISSHYHDNYLSDKGTPFRQPLATIFGDDDAADPFIINSATALRTTMNTITSDCSINLENTKNSVPSDVYRFLVENHLKTYPITEEDFSLLIKYKLLTQNNLLLHQYVDISKDLADRMKHISDLNLSILELAQKIKTKNMTLTRINRALIHLLLNIHSDDFLEYNQNGYTPYARVLGIRKEATHLLRKIQKNGRIPIITKVATAESQLDPLGMRMLSEDLFASHLYNQAVYEKYKTSIANEYKHGIILL